MVVVLLIFFCAVGATCGPKAPARTSPAYSDSTGGSVPDTQQHKSPLMKKEP